MHVVVIGAGAIGCYIGGALQQGGFITTLLGREPSLRPLQNAGHLLLTNYRGLDARIPMPNLSSTPEILAEADLIIVAVKCLAMRDVVQDIARWAQPSTPIITLQNGIGSENVLIDRLPRIQLHRGIVGFNVARLAGNHFHCGTDGELFIEQGLAPSVLAQLQQALQLSDIQLQKTQDFVALRWAKLQLNLNNAINALSDLPLKEQLAHRDYRRVLAMAMRELLDVTQALNIELPKLTRVNANWLPTLLSLPNFIFTRLTSSMLAIDPQARSSMWDDLQQGRFTEVDFLNGAVVEAADHLGIPAPTNRMLCKLIHTQEKQAQRTPFSAQTLLQQVNK